MSASFPRTELLPAVVASANLVGARPAVAWSFAGTSGGTGLARSIGAMVRAAGLGLWLGLLVVACGGRTEGGVPGSSSGSERGEGSPDPSGSDPDTDSDCGSLYGECDEEGDTALGECKLGFPMYGTGKPCAWVADDRCYDTREMACNCECPRDRDSHCVSGFDGGPDGRVLVECR